MKKLLSIAMAGILLFALAAVALAADEVTLSVGDATVAEGDFIANGDTLVNTELEGFYAEWKNVPASTHVRLKYDRQGTDGNISLYVNGKLGVKIPIKDTGTWWDTFPESEKVKVNIPEGATIRLQVDEGDVNANISSVILTKGVAAEEDDGGADSPKTGDPGMILYIAMAGAAGSALVLRKKIKK